MLSDERFSLTGVRVEPRDRGADQVVRRVGRHDVGQALVRGENPSVGRCLIDANRSALDNVAVSCFRLEQRRRRCLARRNVHLRHQRAVKSISGESRGDELEPARRGRRGELVLDRRPLNLAAQDAADDRCGLSGPCDACRRRTITSVEIIGARRDVRTGWQAGEFRERAPGGVDAQYLSPLAELRRRGGHCVEHRLGENPWARIGGQVGILDSQFPF
jgi:hypothetical protein